MRVALSIVALAITLLIAGRAQAFHAGVAFMAQPGTGGGGGVFYAGAPKDHGWNCRSCHEAAEGRITVSLDSPDLFSSFKYSPGKTYNFKAIMNNEWKGVGAQANYNTVTIQVVDAKGEPTGQLQAPPDDFYSTGAATIAGKGTKPNETSWTFRWTAPATGTGQVRFFVAAVDGNGAGLSSGTLTDPGGDDVFTGSVVVDESAQAGTKNRPSYAGGCLIGFAAVLLRIRTAHPRKARCVQRRQSC